MTNLPIPTTPYYGGKQAYNPANVKMISGTPSTNDTASALGTLAVDPVAETMYALVSKAGGTATWAVLGSSTIPQYPLTVYVVGPLGEAPYQTIQAALNVAEADNPSGAQIFIKPKADGSAYTENLSLSPNMTICSFSSLNVAINGHHQPPSTGTVVFNNLTLTATSGNVIDASALPYSSNIIFNNCTFNITNGVIYNGTLINGSLTLNECQDNSAINGIINAPNASLFVYNSNVGVTSFCLCNTATIENSTLNNGLSIASGTSNLLYTSMFGPVFIASGATLYVKYSNVQVLGNAAITMAGSSNCTLVDSLLFSDSSNTIAGVGNVTVNGYTLLGSPPAGGIALTYAGTYLNNNITANTLISAPTFSGTTVNASTVNGTTVEGATVKTTGVANNISMANQVITAGGSNTNVNVIVTPKGTGNLEVTTGNVTIDAGNVDVTGSIIVESSTGISHIYLPFTGVASNPILGLIPLTSGNGSLTSNAVTNSSVILLTPQGLSSSQAKWPSVVSVAAGLAIIGSGNAGDNYTCSLVIFEPGPT